MEHFVFLESSGREETLAADRAEEGPRRLLVGLVRVEGQHVPLQVSRHPHPLAAEVAVGVLPLVVLHHVQVQLMFEVEQLLADVTLELGAYLVL